MSAITNRPCHVVLFPFMSRGHTIPLLHLARLLLRRRVALTVFTTPANLPFVADFLPDNHLVSIIDIPFPENIPGVPPGIESTDRLPSISLFPEFALSTVKMRSDFESELERLPRVDFMVSDAFLWWTLDSAHKFGFLRLGFYGMSTYAPFNHHVILNPISCEIPTKLRHTHLKPDTEHGGRTNRIFLYGIAGLLLNLLLDNVRPAFFEALAGSSSIG